LYSQFEELVVSREAAQIAPVAPSSTPLPAYPAFTPIPASPSVSADVGRDVALGLPAVVVLDERRVAVPTPDPTPTALPTPIPIYPAERIVAKSIGLDSKVV